MAWRLLLLSLLLLVAPHLHAQGLESALAPGPVIRGHVKAEEQCASCHVRFDRAAQDGRCAECHKEVGQDIKSRAGFHGRQKPQACRSCHTDHKGRDVQIAPLDKKSFDHKQTDWVLQGAHAPLDCAKCHTGGKRWAEAPQECNACHRKDDVHKGSLGAKCADCHTENRWTEAKFDHDTTKFVLKGKHVDVKCRDCHRAGQPYADAPETCVGCHRADDRDKGHKGRYGDKCESCHDAKSWRGISFNHDTETRYLLRGKHRAVKCDNCHTGTQPNALYRDKLGNDCLACHKKDDKHKGSLGAECQACHQESNWKETGRFDHDRSRFPLLGKHVDADCKACHKTTNYRDAPSTCIGCHRADDKHERNLGEGCGACHGEKTWKIPRFDHEVTRFALRGGHAVQAVTCKSCHADLKHYRDTPRDCIGCHKKDDKHEAQLGERCESCHTDLRWRDTPRFDHARARFPLVGSHLPLKCSACHATPRYRDAARDCVGCHRKDDKHKDALGTACESCHNQRAWALVRYDHARQARYPLEGGHARASCAACHRQPAPTGKAIAPVGRECIACHRSDDAHDGGFGPRCDTCHVVTDWKTLRARRPGTGGTATPGVTP